MNETNLSSNNSVVTSIECPICGSNRVDVSVEMEIFEYGSGVNAVELKAQVPLYTCTDCDFEFTNELAEARRHEAVCRYLGILTPSEIVALRNGLGMTRAAFSELTSLGEASLGRWERGTLFQNKAYDKLLRLLFHKENVSRLQSLSTTEVPAVAVADIYTDASDVPTFDALSPEQITTMRKSAEVFQLRPAKTG